MELNGSLLFATELGFSLGISFATARVLTPPLQPLLADLCHGAARAHFWVVFTVLMLFICPLLFVVWGSSASAGAEFIVVLRGALIRTLMGIFLALSAVGYLIWRTIAVPKEAAS